jgi:hypothetical protein
VFVEDDALFSFDESYLNTPLKESIKDVPTKCPIDKIKK